MKTIWDFPVTQPYGYDKNYPLNGGMHLGVDYGAPTGTPITVNGVTVGLSGATGYVSGPHTHVGKWKDGKSSDPKSGGKTFKSAVVTEVSEDPTNGKFVRVQGDGYSWVYLHMSKQLVKVGDKLEDDMYQGKTAKEWADSSAKWQKLAENRQKRILAADKALAVGR